MTASRERTRRGIGFAFVIVAVMSASLLVLASKPSDSETIWVSRADGGKSCAPDSAETPEKAAAALRSEGISVLELRKQGDGKMHAQMCGIQTGNENAVRIPKGQLSKAMAAGFKLADSDAAPVIKSAKKSRKSKKN